MGIPVLPPCTKSQRGFTLIELIITMAVLAVVAGIAFPSFQSMIANQRVKSAANGLAMGLVYTRSEAVKRGGRVSMKAIEGDWSNGWQVISVTDDEVLRSESLSGVVLEQLDGWDDVEIVYLKSGRPDLDLDPDEIDEKFTVCDGGGKATMRTLSLRFSGQTNIISDGSCAP